MRTNSLLLPASISVSSRKTSPVERLDRAVRQSRDADIPAALEPLLDVDPHPQIFFPFGLNLFDIRMNVPDLGAGQIDRIPGLLGFGAVGQHKRQAARQGRASTSEAPNSIGEPCETPSTGNRFVCRE